MAKESVEKNESKVYIEDIEIVPDEIQDKKEEILSIHATTVQELNKTVVLPYQEYDCVINSGNIPIDVAASKAYYVLKTGGEFIVDKKTDLSVWMDVILSLFDIKETNKDSVIFVKVN